MATSDAFVAILTHGRMRADRQKLCVFDASAVTLYARNEGRSSLTEKKCVLRRLPRLLRAK